LPRSLTVKTVIFSPLSMCTILVSRHFHHASQNRLQGIQQPPHVAGEQLPRL